MPNIRREISKHNNKILYGEWWSKGSRNELNDINCIPLKRRDAWYWMPGEQCGVQGHSDQGWHKPGGDLYRLHCPDHEGQMERAWLRYQAPWKFWDLPLQVHPQAVRTRNRIHTEMGDPDESSPMESHQQHLQALYSRETSHPFPSWRLFPESEIRILHCV